MQTAVGDTLINYEVFGTNNPTVIILHGWGKKLDHNNWVQIAKPLSSKFRIFLVDLPGFGGSTIPPKAILGIQDYADIMIQLFRKLKITNPTLLGHSFGGKIGTVIASRFGISKLVLVSPSGYAERSFVIKLRILLTSFAKKILPDKIRQLLLPWFSSADYLEAGELSSTFKLTVSQTVEKFAKKVKAKTLIIWGDQDNVLPVTIAKNARALIPNSLVRIVWGTGHFPHIDDKNKFLEILTEFI